MGERATAAATNNAAAPDPLIGRVISDRFKIKSLMARGGMGKVYRAEQAPLGRTCAVKVLSPNYSGDHDPEFHKRFFLEASIASKLTHPNTVTIFDYGRTEDDIYYMAMEYLEGQTLHRAIREAGHFHEDRVAHVARQICRGLREAHSLGVIHRDLKPANIFLVEHGDESDFVKVLDFGLVKNVTEASENLTQAGLFMGSPKYMSPEQIRGEKVDARTDVYALGIIMYEMITGKVPFDRPNSVHILMAQVKEAPPPLRDMNPDVQVSSVIEETIFRCMAKEPDQRFRSMDEVLAVLKRVGTLGSMTMSGSVVADLAALSRSASGPQLVPPRSSSSPAAAIVPQALKESGSIPSPKLAPPPPRAPSGAPPSQSPSANVDAPPADTSTTNSQTTSQALGRPSRHPPLVVGALAVLALAAVGYASFQKKPAPVLVAAPTTPTITASEPVDVPLSQTLPGAVHVRVNTDPDGATINEEGVELCASTPCEILYRATDADPSREHKLIFTRQGYLPLTKAITVGDSPLQVKLTKAPDAPRAP